MSIIENNKHIKRQREKEGEMERMARPESEACLCLCFGLIDFLESCCSQFMALLCLMKPSGIYQPSLCQDQHCTASSCNHIIFLLLWHMPSNQGDQSCIFTGTCVCLTEMANKGSVKHVSLYMLIDLDLIWSHSASNKRKKTFFSTKSSREIPGSRNMGMQV